uniref:TIR domain-containing protein n=1 Tax=Eptatretus burgeri TaxID=7764 RepID=A0A8C4N5L5_EPTBU
CHSCLSCIHIHHQLILHPSLTLAPSLFSSNNVSWALVDLPGFTISLNLSHNKISQLKERQFEQLPKLEKLILQRNSLKTLITLNLENNCLSLKGLSTLDSLDLSQNEITNFSVEVEVKVKCLILCRNNITKLEFSSRFFPYVQKFDFSHNKIYHMSDDLFLNFTNLKYLVFNNNPLNISVLKYSGLLRLDELYVSNLAIRSSSLSELCDFSRRVKLRKLIANYNQITTIESDKSFFIPLANLTALSLQSNKVLDIERFAFKNLPNLRQLSLAVNLIKEVRPNMFQGLNSLQRLNLGKNKISFNSPAALKQPPFTHLRNLERLNLQSQQPHGINYVPNNLFQGLQKLKGLTIKNNPDKHLGEQAFWSLVNLEVLDLSYSESIIRPLKSLETLNIKFNPLSCSCLNFWFQNWSKINKKTEVSYLKAIPCYVNFQKRQQKFVNFDLSTCLYHNGIVYFLTTTVVLTFLIIIPIIHHKGRWYFLYGWYFVQAWVHERRTDRTREERYQYDAFVSYSSNDEQWVFNELLENLERANPPHFKLCLHHRDFEVGKFIVDNIADSIRNSRKTICVVSRNFLQSEWCNMELQLAGYRLFEEHCDVLILIFLEEIQSHELSNYHQLRKFMRSRTYINWPPYDIGAQKLFWMKALNTLLNMPLPACKSIFCYLKANCDEVLIRIT